MNPPHGLADKIGEKRGEVKRILWIVGNGGKRQKNKKQSSPRLDSIRRPEEIVSHLIGQAPTPMR
jgi:hypothetical protein